MLYNIEKKKIKTATTCVDCPYLDKALHRCEGINKCCFEYDAVTKTIIDGVTKLPLKVGNNG